jgi:hypothetical protein
LSAGTEPSVEVLERLFEPDLGWVELAHRRGETVFGEVVGPDLAGRGD